MKYIVYTAGGELKSRIRKILKSSGRADNSLLSQTTLYIERGDKILGEIRSKLKYKHDLNGAKADSFKMLEEELVNAEDEVKTLILLLWNLKQIVGNKDFESFVLELESAVVKT